MKEKHKKQTGKRATSVARQIDGTIQITLIIGADELEKEINNQAIEAGKTLEVAGFRKGKAPVEKVIENISREKLTEKALRKILPRLFNEAVEENKIRPAMYPKFEIISAKEGEDWQIRAVTCEINEIKLGNYRKAIQGALRAKAIWTPNGNKSEEKRELTREEKEQLVMEELIGTVELKLPAVLVEQEREGKLAALLERLEKLGLSLESYLSSINKTAENLREEYREQAERTIKLELILTKIVEEEGVKVGEDEVEKFLEAAGGDPNMKKENESAEQRRLISLILGKRKVIDSLISAA